MAGRRAPGTVEPMWYRESAKNLTWELSVPRIVALEHASKFGTTNAPPGARRHSAVRGRHGTHDRAVRWAGCPQEDRGRVRARARRATRADVRDDDRRVAGPARLAPGPRRHPCRDGEHGRLLEADLLRARRYRHVCAR